MGDFIVVFYFNCYNVEWVYCFGYGFYLLIVLWEVGVVNIQDWCNVMGSGFFMFDEYIQGNLQFYVCNDFYWDNEVFSGKSYVIFFVDWVNYWIIKDEVIQFSVLCIGKIDIVEVVCWIVVDYLKKSMFELLWLCFLSNVGMMIVLCIDQRLFDD